MPVKLTVPALGESVSEAMIAQWFVKQGEHVARDQPVCEIESDKVNVEIPAPVAGVLVEILKQPGESVAVGEVVAHLEPAEGFPKEVRPEATPVAREPVTQTQPASSRPTAPAQEMPAGAAPAPQPAAPQPVPWEAQAAERLSPAVRRIVTEEQVSPAEVTATGPGGRITKGDVITHLEQRQAAPQPVPAVPVPAPPAAPVPAAPAPAARPAPAAPALERDLVSREERVRMSPLRRKVAQRLVETQHTAAILTTFNEIDMSAVMALRQKYQESFQKRYGIKLGFMSFFVKACIDALKQFPGVNAEIDGDNIVYKHYYDIGVAVGGGKGLVVPVIRDADRKSFAELEKVIADLGTRARDNKLTIEELAGGTFTISNGGIYGSMMSTPILNGPQTGILGMHRIMDRPVAVDGQVVIRPMMYIALSYDHRVIDGREAVSFLIRIKECIEMPERMLVEV